jgi:hypothetical protein
MTESAVLLCSLGPVGVPLGSRMNVNERRRSQIIGRRKLREKKGVLLNQTAHNGLVAGSPCRAHQQINGLAGFRFLPLLVTAQKCPDSLLEVEVQLPTN